MFNRSVPAAVVGTLLCIATIGVFVIALFLANVDSLNEMRADRRRSTIDTTSNADASSSPTEQNVEIGLVEMTPEAQSNNTRELGGGGSTARGCSSPREDKDNTQDQDATQTNSLPWSLLELGNSTLCGVDAEPPPVEDAARTPAVE